jgi:YggT family protein
MGIYRPPLRVVKETGRFCNSTNSHASGCRRLAASRPNGYTSGWKFPNHLRIWPAMIELLGFISYLISLYVYVVLASVILSWLMAFGVVNPYNRFVNSLAQALAAVTEPLLRPIRNALPDFGGIDFSPLILLLGCFFVQSVVLPNIAKLFL